MQPVKCDSCKKYYDADKYEICPHCATAAPSTSSQNEPVYEPVVNIVNNTDNNEKKAKKGSRFSFSKLISSKNKTPETNNNNDVKQEEFVPPADDISQVQDSSFEEKCIDNPVDEIFAIDAEENIQTEVPANNKENVAEDHEGYPAEKHEEYPTEKHEEYPAEKHEEYPAEKHEEYPAEKHEETVAEEKLSEAVNQADSTGKKNDFKTVAYYNFSNEIDPVVGWLVCIKGEYKGESFKLKSGRNFIGRSLTMDVALAMEKSVSRERHAAITFDPFQSKFFVQSGESHGLTYVNNELLMTFKELKKGDIIAVASCELMFYPLCGEGFSWDNYK